MRNDETRPVPKAKAEIVARLGRTLHDVRAAWLVSGVVGMVGYFMLVPVTGLVAELELQLVVLVPTVVLGLAVPKLGAMVGEAHARSLVRRRLPVLVKSVAARHGASPVELEPELREDVRALLEDEE